MCDGLHHLFNVSRRGEWEEGEEDLALLGTDFAFFTAFLTAFLFNWVGFLLLMCFCHTIAARYGALAGFGLSLSKWTLIVKRSTELVRDENAWLWWLVLSFGFLICVRACTQVMLPYEDLSFFMLVFSLCRSRGHGPISHLLLGRDCSSSTEEEDKADMSGSQDDNRKLSKIIFSSQA